MRSETNSVSHSKYVFQPKRYDENDNIICVLSKRTKYKNNGKYLHRDKHKLTGVYKFDENKFVITWVADGFYNASHKKLLNYFLKEYEWDDCIELNCSVL